ncbi:protein of unknown function [endosymbiont DhMRE of Dentiscutata heterogama]|uniref:hypothetical protein n=1 Tax=endosymbiont DhMRE of Dentiscutata heterogama TaxID=1609546 RepID=UPI000629D98F|nr:hypothetical protein [endosymbiont DhMRE of Dentiscutata heterogama]CFW93045.1 protein of unknown function [endosymbiont DhMRE of Dentiscutata heterogama]
MEQKLSNQQFNEDERKIKEKELEVNRQLLAEKDRELDKLRGSRPTNPQQAKNNNGLKWAIGLGIVAVVISLLCFILLLKKRKD